MGVLSSGRRRSAGASIIAPGPADTSPHAPAPRTPQVAREVQPLSDAAEFLVADSVEAFVLSYTALLTASPGVSPTLLAGLVNARASSDRAMTKADAREVCAAWGRGL